MSTVSYLEAQQNFATVLQKATKENIIIDGTDGNKFILAIFKKAKKKEKQQTLSERFAGSLHLTDEQYNNFQKVVSSKQN
jgi:hypothetical protein